MKNILVSIRLLVFFTFITGLIYPVIMSLAGQLIFPVKTEGEILYRNGHAIGAKLISQKFVSDRYFWSRPSSVDYNPLPSGGSNLGPTSAALEAAVRERKTKSPEAPQDLLFASASGLDPEISPEAARFQLERVAKARNLTDVQKQSLAQLIQNNTKYPDLGFIGAFRVNVLALNLAMDAMVERSSPQ